MEVEEDEFDRDIDRAFKTIAREVRLPGFRNGKAPRRVLEARIGIGPAREQALRDSIPQYLAKAVREHDVDIIATPQIEITGGQEEGPVEFDATIEIRPEITVPGYGGLRVELPSPDATDEEIESVDRGRAAPRRLARRRRSAGRDRRLRHPRSVGLARRRGRPRPQHRGLVVRDRSGLGRRRIRRRADRGHRRATSSRSPPRRRAPSSRPSSPSPCNAVQELVAARAHRRLRGREPRRVRDGRRMASVDRRAHQHRQAQSDPSAAGAEGDRGVDRAHRHRGAGTDGRERSAVAHPEHRRASSPPRASTSRGGWRPPGRTRTRSSKGCGSSRNRRSRPTSRCAPSPPPKRSRSTTTTSNPSTHGSRCRSVRRPRTSARRTSATTPCPSSPPSCASRKHSTGCCTTSKSSTRTASRSIVSSCSAILTTTTRRTITTAHDDVADDAAHDHDDHEDHDEPDHEDPDTEGART